MEQENIYRELKSEAEKRKGVMLSKDEVVDLVSEGNTQSPGAIVDWLGFELAAGLSAEERFVDVTRENFNSLSDEDKKRYIKGAASFMFNIYPRSVENLFGYYRRLGVKGEGGAIYEKDLDLSNVGELLLTALEFSGDDIEAARQVMGVKKQTATVGKNQESQKITLDILYGKSDETYNSPTYERGRDEILSKNPKAAELAFLIVVDRGDLSIGKLAFDRLIKDIYPRSDRTMKARILEHIASEIQTPTAPPRRVREVRLLMSESRRIYEEDKGQDPEAPFVKAYDRVQASLEYKTIAMSVKKGRVDIRVFTNLLEAYPELLGNVTYNELQVAYDKAKDKAMKERVQRLMREKDKYPDVIE